MLPIVDNVLREQQRVEENNALRLQRRMLRAQSNPFNLPEARFVELFRLTKPLAETIIDNLRPHLAALVYANCIDIPSKVLLTLRFYGTGSYQGGLGMDFNFGVSQWTVHRFDNFST